MVVVGKAVEEQHLPKGARIEAVAHISFLDWYPKETRGIAHVFSSRYPANYTGPCMRSWTFCFAMSQPSPVGIPPSRGCRTGSERQHPYCPAAMAQREDEQTGASILAALRFAHASQIGADGLSTNSRGLLDLPQRPSLSSQGHDLLFLLVVQDIRHVATCYLPSRAVNVLDVSSESMAAFQVFT